MTRIVAGSVGGRMIKVPTSGTRPTSAKVREALFSKLENWNLINGVEVLDLFAGSGALGIEAISRGANQAVFVDQSRRAIQVIKDNLAALKLTANARCYCQNALAWVGEQTKPTQFDLVFVDPPYAWPEESLAEMLRQLESILSQEGLIVVERSARSPQPQLSPGLCLEDSRIWGDTSAWLIGHQPESPRIEE